MSKVPADVARFALEFIEQKGGYSIGTIDSKEKMYAAYIHAQLEKEGYLYVLYGDDGPFYNLTELGREFLQVCRKTIPIN